MTPNVLVETRCRQRTHNSAYYREFSYMWVLTTIKSWLQIVHFTLHKILMENQI